MARARFRCGNCGHRLGDPTRRHCPGCGGDLDEVVILLEPPLSPARAVLRLLLFGLLIVALVYLLTVTLAANTSKPLIGF